MSKLSKKSEIIEDFNWSEVLGCAPSDCSEQVKKILHRGIHGILWDDITQSMFPIETVSLAKKNLLLDQLKNNVQVPVIQNIRNAKRLSEERKKIASEIDKILAKCQKKEEIIQSKVLKIEKIKSQKKSVEIKKQLLELKYREMKNQMNDCKEMRSVCQELLPASQSGINESTINDCLSRVGAISSRSDKKEAWKYIHENLSGIKITELWDLILQKRIQDSEELFRLGGQEDSIDDNLINKKSNQRLEIGIAKAYGQHISWTLDRYIYLEKMREHRDKGMHCVEKILENDTTNELSDWLLVTIEISQLEAKKTVLLSEIDKLKDSANELSSIGGELRQLECNMHEINDNLENTVQKLQKSLALFEPAIQFISTLKEKLSVALKMILNLHEEHLVEPEWTSINLSIELEVFQEKLVIQALDKIMLGGEIGAYRHVSTCMSNALISHPVLSSASPIMRAPIYQIVDAFQNQTINSALKKRRQYIEATNKFDHNIQSICSGYQRENDIISVLDDTLLVSKKCQQENAKFKSIYDAWINQSVQGAMSIYTDTVHGATFNEWQQRFTNLLYIIQRNK